MREYEIYSGFIDKILEIILEISLWGDQIHLNKKNSLDITVIIETSAYPIFILCLLDSIY